MNSPMNSLVNVHSVPAMVVVRPERFVAGGEAFARQPDGRVLFVRGAVPGDEVDVEITEHKRDWARGSVVGVIRASPNRVTPPCPQRLAGCGGCDWQHVAVPVQLAAKCEIVADALRRTAKLTEAEVRAGASVDPDGYRTTIRVVGDAHRRPAFREERSNSTAPALGCLVAAPPLRRLLDGIDIAPGVDVTLRVSLATGEATALWRGAADDVGGLSPDLATGPTAVLHEDVARHRFRVSAGSFFQSGPAAAELLVTEVRAAAPELANARHVLDAYAGVGLLGLATAAPEARLTTIESSRSSVADCRVNLAGRQANIVDGDVARWRPRHGERYDVVLADPARPGLGKPGTSALAAAGAPVLVLVSCDPVSLARDTVLLAAAGYRHAGTTVLDLFPHTHHVEAVTRFVLAD
jgi:23S rRNA (uracil1939-C5)-methyltransferase